MSNPQNLGPLEVTCDAPPYPIVQACNAIGIGDPEDVPWVRMDHYLEFAREQNLRERGFFMGGEIVLCVCREKLPKLAKYRFTYSSGDEVTYSVGQCHKCRKVFWTQG